MAILSVWAHLLTLASTISAYVIHGTPRPRDNSSRSNPMQQVDRREVNPNPADFGWINRWAAIGDSFTAGIGSGHLYSDEDEVSRCSRYSHSYPALINDVLGPAVDNFQFVACSGDRSQQIYDQVQHLNGNLNFVIMTAGGNDLCLAAMIRSCIFLPTTENGCQTVIDKAQQNIDTILKPNLKQILLALDTKMAQNSIVVFNGYAQFFNTANEACAIEQSWILAGNGLMKLTIERRKKFNTLVKNINNAIQEVVDDITQNSNVKYKIGVADWDYWPREGVKGQFCDPSSTGRYPDPEQPDLQFFKLDTQISPYPSDELKRRVLEQEHTMLYDMANSTDIYNSLLYRSINPPAEALHKLDPRAPSPPNCPGDSIDLTLGLGLPDSLGKVFHPNELGHETISAFALETMISLRADILGVSTSVCEITEEFKCWQKEGRKGYANANRLNENYKDFCNHFVKQPENIVGWKAEKTYHKTTPEEHSFLIELSGNTGIYDKQQCLESFDRIINGCDGNDPKNPMNWKFGGRYVRGEYTYEVNIKRDTRPWPPIKSPKGSCEGWYYGSLSSYVLRGAGWSTWDGGQQTILPSLKACLGLGITGWHFGYYNEADYDGMEWEVVFNTPIWVRSRCFKNNKVAIASGGFTNGCGGNDW